MTAFRRLAAFLAGPSLDGLATPYVPMAAVHPPPPDDVDPPRVPYDPADDHQPWVAGGALTARPSTLAEEIAVAHRAHVRTWATVAAEPDPEPERLVVPWIVPGET